MSRQLHRVPLDFAWKIGERWVGYLNPLYKAHKCEHCGGNGFGPYANQLQDQWYSYKQTGFRAEDNGCTPVKYDEPWVQEYIAHKISWNPESARYYGSGPAAVDREARRMCEIWNTGWSYNLNQMEVNHLYAMKQLPWRAWREVVDGKWRDKPNYKCPSASEMNMTGCIDSMFTCSSILYYLVKYHCAKLGISPTCLHCGGHGEVWDDPMDEYLYETWEEYDPPEGDGYQMWETVSEGSPISPVFATAEELARWLANDLDREADRGTTYGQWLAMIKGPGWCPSGGMINGEGKTGVQMVVHSLDTVEDTNP